MKKFFLLFAVLGLFTFSANAQKKACSMTKKACSMKKAASVDANSPAAVLAAQSDNIETRVCSKSGSVSYVQKNVCATSGNVSFTDVKYCSTAKKFVNVSPSDMETEGAVKAVKTTTTKKAACTKSKAACTKSAAVKATKVSKVTAAKKACTKKDAACCTKGKNKAVSAKLVKSEE